MKLKALERDRLAALLSRGFDESERSGDAVRVGCSGCAPSIVDGVPLHEAGCTNEQRSGERVS